MTDKERKSIEQGIRAVHPYVLYFYVDREYGVKEMMRISHISHPNPIDLCFEVLGKRYIVLGQYAFLESNHPTR
jgi:hypothetical protein